VCRSFVVAVMAVVMLTGCSDSEPSDTDTTGTATTTAAQPTDTTGDATTAADPTVTSFEVGDLSCGHGVAAPVSISWKTENATAVLIALDDSSPTGYGPAGSTQFYVACDAAVHTISITPLSDTGQGAKQSEKVSPA